ncbi:hypothetical protein DXG01_011814 [Tephrocybe rancida]|nr:hypothetical protein DXG01_011814 [Tephrocybe rancida]
MTTLPGFTADDNTQADNITVDVLFPSREVTEGSREHSKFIALAVQVFGSEIALPYLRQHALRCAEEGLTPQKAPVPGNTLKTAGQLYLPASVSLGGSHFRCHCHKGTAHDLAQDILLEDQGLGSFTSFGPQDVSSVAGMQHKRTITMKDMPPPIQENLDDGYGGIIISLGPRTDAILSRYNFSNQKVIPKV